MTLAVVPDQIVGASLLAKDLNHTTDLADER